MLHTKYQGSRSSGFKQEIFNVFISKIYFSLCDLDMRRSRTILKIVKEGHKKIIPAKCSQNQGSSLGGDVL